MHKLLIFLHVLFAVFAVGPLVAAATTAARGVRTADASAVAQSSRTIRIYGYVSLIGVLLGFGLVQDKWHAKFSYPWIWVSVLLYAVALAVTLAILVPALEQAGRAIGAGSAANSFTARVAAAGGLVGVLFAAIVFLMVYRPGGYDYRSGR